MNVSLFMLARAGCKNSSTGFHYKRTEKEGGFRQEQSLYKQKLTKRASL